MSYQLIALDLDGTLLTDNKDITPQTLELLQRLREQGKHIAVCTGRAALSVDALLKNKDFATHLITDNGGTVRELNTNQTLYSNTIPRTFLETMKQVMETYGVHCDVTTENGIYVERLTEQMVEQYRQYLVEPVAVGDLRETPEDPMKFTISGEPNVLDEVIPELTKEYSGGLNIVRSGEYFIDVMKAGTTKGKALAVLVDHLDLQAKDILAMGNYYNDLEMLRYAGLGIAMDNSPEDLKAEADEVTLSKDRKSVV